MRVPLRDTGWAGRIRATLLVLAIFAMPTALAFAEPPEVAEILEPAPGSAPLNPADVHMEAIFDDEDGDDHKCSDWEIWTVPPAPEEPVWRALCAEGVEKAHIHLGDGDFVNSHAGRTELKYDTEYELRVRFRDDSGAPEDGDWSDWQERRFRTVEEGPAGNKSEAWTARPGYVVEEFASGFRLPVNIAMVPDPGPHLGDPLFYVAELYGGIKVVTRDGVVRDYATDLLNYNPNGIFPGTGEQGLAGLVVEPESGDLFASLVYADEEVAGNPHYTKVIRLHSDERRWEAVGEPETVLDMKELVGASHQISHLEITPDGNMFVHNADGGFHNPPRDLESFRGKILRMTLDGEPVATNPFFTAGEDTPRDYVYSLGHRNPFGGAWRRSDSSYFVVENGPKTDRLVRINAGQDYGWEGNDANMTIGASYNWFPAHAPVNLDFVEPDAFGGSGFPPVVQDHAFVTESGPTYASGPQVRGKRIVEFALGGSGELLGGPLMLAEYTGTGKATAVGLAPGPDGLYFTDLYKDQGFSPIDPGAKVLLVRYCGSSCPASPQPPAVAGAANLAPRIERFGVRRKVFRARGGGDARSSAAKFGTAFRYSLSERASVRIRIKPIVRGWRSRGSCRLLSRKVRDRLKARGRLRRCLLPAARGYKAGGRCRPWRSRHVRRGRLCALRGPRGAIAAPGRAGWNRRPYFGRLREKPLRPGPYLAIARARDRTGKSSRPRRAAFRVVRGAQ